MSPGAIVRTTVTVLLGAAALVAPVAAEEKIGWSDSAELSYVVTDGNSNTQTLGFKNELRRRWEKALFLFKLAAIDAENTSTSRFAVGADPLNFSVQETDSTEKTADRSFAEARYDRNIHPRLFWFAGSSWEENVLAGIDRRIVGFGGVGNTWYDTEKIKFKSDYSVTYTDQKDVIEDPFTDDSFAGLRFTTYYEHKFTETTTYINEIYGDFDLEESSHWRGRMLNSVAVTISKRLALKASLLWTYENEPALEEIPLFDSVGGTQTGTVFVPVEELDTVFTTSLVANF